jgi:hypothetical protein
MRIRMSGIRMLRVPVAMSGNIPSMASRNLTEIGLVFSGGAAGGVLIALLWNIPRRNEREVSLWTGGPISQSRLLLKICLGVLAACLALTALGVVVAAL